MVRTLPGAVEFSFEDPHAFRVQILACGPGGRERVWEMTPAGGGRWIASLRLAVGPAERFDFRYLVDERFWALDAGTRTIVRDAAGNCRSRVGEGPTLARA